MESVRAIVASTRKFWSKIAALLIFLTGCTADNRVLEEIIEKVYTVEPNTSISIHNRDGAVMVYGGESNEIRVQSVKKAYSRERLNQIAIDVSAKPGFFSITTQFPTQPNWGLSDRSGTVDYSIVVPETAGISALELNAGEILLYSMRGPQVRARLNDGRIFARNCFTNLNLTTNRGRVTLTYDWWERRKVSAQINIRQGNAWVSLPSEAAFRLVAYAGRGKIANDFNNIPLSANSSPRETNVDQIINGGGSAIIKVETGDGNIKIAEANP